MRTMFIKIPLSSSEIYLICSMKLGLFDSFPNIRLYREKEDMITDDFHFKNHRNMVIRCFR